MDKRYDVFISYSIQDQKVVEGICGFLERKGYRCFVAYRDIPIGVVWATAITEAIDASAMMVVVFSNFFNISSQTDREIEIASENQMPILTFRVTDSEMTGAKKYYLKNLNWIDAFPNPEKSFGQMFDSVYKLIGVSALEKNCAVNYETNDLAVDKEQRQKVVIETKESVEVGRLKHRRNKTLLFWIIGGVATALIVFGVILLWFRSTDSFEGHGYVDLGLPSGTLWATCNIGSSSPEDYGDYFAWGETQTKSYYNWATYKYAVGRDSTFTKYCINPKFNYNGYKDNLSILQGSDDAAMANCGNEWCMPTREQWNELLENTTNQWRTQNGVFGRLFTARNGQTLFLPAAGCHKEKELHSAGFYGFYWSNSLSTSNGAMGLYFVQNECHIGAGFRFYGFPIRPVRKK